jgi:hypothetical protein
MYGYRESKTLGHSLQHIAIAPPILSYGLSFSGLHIRTSSTTMAILCSHIKVFQPEIVQLFVRCGRFTSIGAKLIATMFNQIEQVIGLEVMQAVFWGRTMLFDAIMQEHCRIGGIGTAGVGVQEREEQTRQPPASIHHVNIKGLWLGNEGITW